MNVEPDTPRREPSDTDVQALQDYVRIQDGVFLGPLDRWFKNGVIILPHRSPSRVRFSDNIEERVFEEPEGTNEDSSEATLIQLS